MQQTVSVVVERSSVPGTTSEQRFVVRDDPISIPIEFWVYDTKEQRILAKCYYEIDAKRIAASLNMVVELSESLCSKSPNIDILLGLL